MTEPSANSDALAHIYWVFGNGLSQLATHARINSQAHILSMYSIGYADTAADRETRLENRDLHNALMEFTRQYLTIQGVDVRIHTTPICPLTRQEIMPVAEKLLGRLTRARYDVGGFTIPHLYSDIKPVGSLSEVEWVAHRRWLVKETAQVENMEKELECRLNLNIRDNTPGRNMESLNEALQEARALTAQDD